MVDGSTRLASVKPPELGSELEEAANLAVHNLGFQSPLSALCGEHWQLVLGSVSNRMLMRGNELPPGWQFALAKLVGRRKEASSIETSVVSLRTTRKLNDQDPQF